GDDDDVAARPPQVGQGRVDHREAGGRVGVELATEVGGRDAGQVDHRHVRTRTVGEDGDAVGPPADPVEGGRDLVVVPRVHRGALGAELGGQIGGLGGAVGEHQRRVRVPGAQVPRHRVPDPARGAGDHDGGHSAQFRLEDLAGGVAGEGADELHAARALEVGQVLGGEVQDVLLRERRALAPDHERLADLSHPLVRHADHRVFDHAVQAGQRLLDLRGVHVEAAVDVHVLESVGDAQVAALIDLADVAGAEPAVVGEGFRRVLRVVQVALHDHLAAGEDLAVLADPDLHPGVGAPAGGG